MALWLDGAEAIGAERARRELDLLVVEKPLNMAASQDNTGGGGGEREQRGRVSIGWAHTTSACPCHYWVCSLCHASICISCRKGVRHPNAPLAALRCAAGRTVRARWMPNGQC